MQKNIFVGFAYFDGEMPACALFPGNDKPVMAHTIVGLADQQAQEFGRNWRERVSYEPPIKEVFDGEHNYELIEFTSEAKRIFEIAMGMTLYIP